MFKKVLFTMLLPLACFASSRSIDGPYTLQGWDPICEDIYYGEVFISKVPGQHNVYTLVWNYDNPYECTTGVGIKNDDILSVEFVTVYSEPEQTDVTTSGVISYEIEDKGRELRGNFVYFCDPCKEGTETLYAV